MSVVLINERQLSMHFLFIAYFWKFGHAIVVLSVLPEYEYLYSIIIYILRSQAI